MRDLERKLDHLEKSFITDYEINEEVHKDLEGLHPLDKMRILVDLGIIKSEVVLECYLEGCKKT